jgi:hypothetical protein
MAHTVEHSSMARTPLQEEKHNTRSYSPLADAMYERLAEEAAAVHKPLEQWIVDILTTDVGASAYAAESHEIPAAALDALGFQRLAPE